MEGSRGAQSTARAPMELTEAMRTTGTCRRFRPDPVPDDVLHRAFDAARFAPHGGNRPPVRWVVGRAQTRPKALPALYLPLWKDYLGARAGRPLSGSVAEA